MILLKAEMNETPVAATTEVSDLMNTTQWNSTWRL